MILGRPVSSKVERGGQSSQRASCSSRFGNSEAQMRSSDPTSHYQRSNDVSDRIVVLSELGLSLVFASFNFLSFTRYQFLLLLLLLFLIFFSPSSSKRVENQVLVPAPQSALKHSLLHPVIPIPCVHNAHAIPRISNSFSFACTRCVRSP